MLKNLQNNDYYLLKNEIFIRYSLNFINIYVIMNYPQ